MAQDVQPLSAEELVRARAIVRAMWRRVDNWHEKNAGDEPQEIADVREAANTDERWLATIADKDAKLAACQAERDEALTSSHDRIQDLEAELTALRARELPGWQTMESAPKDGSFMLFYINEHRVPITGRWFAHSTHADDGWWVSVTAMPEIPTHWAPLPADPIRAVTKGEG